MTVFKTLFPLIHYQKCRAHQMNLICKRLIEKIPSQKLFFEDSNKIITKVNNVEALRRIYVERCLKH